MHVVNVEGSVNTVEPFRPRPVAVKPLGPPDIKLSPPLGQRLFITATDTKTSSRLRDEEVSVRVDTLRTARMNTKYPLQHAPGGGTSRQFQTLAKNTVYQFQNVIPPKSPKEIAGPRTRVFNPGSEPGSVNNLNRIHPEVTRQSDKSKFQDTDKELPPQKPSTFSSASIPSFVENVTSSHIDEIVHQMIDSLNETLLKVFENNAAKGMFNGENVVSEVFGEKGLLGEPSPTSDTIQDALGSPDAERNIQDSTRTAQLDAVMPKSEEAAPKLTMDYSDLQDKFLTLYFRSQGMNASEGLGRRQPMRMTEVEERYLVMPALEDISLVPDEMSSKVRIVLLTRKKYNPRAFRFDSQIKRYSVKCTAK